MATGHKHLNPAKKGRKTLSHSVFEEKRNYTRKKMDTMVSFSTTKGKERYEACCVDVSGTGMLLETGKKLTEGSRLSVLMPPETPGINHTHAFVEVVRVKPIPDQHKFLVGVAIRRID